MSGINSRTDTYSIQAGFPGRTVTEFSSRYTIDVELDDDTSWDAPAVSDRDAKDVLDEKVPT